MSPRLARLRARARLTRYRLPAPNPKQDVDADEEADGEGDADVAPEQFACPPSMGEDRLSHPSLSRGATTPSEGSIERNKAHTYHSSQGPSLERDGV